MPVHCCLATLSQRVFDIRQGRSSKRPRSSRKDASTDWGKSTSRWTSAPTYLGQFLEPFAPFAPLSFFLFMEEHIG